MREWSGGQCGVCGRYAAELHWDVCPRCRRTSKGRSRMKANQVGRPIMVECEECGGVGETQADCSSCGVSLTTANQADAGTEGLLEDCCAKCWAEEEAGALSPADMPEAKGYRVR